MIRDIQISDAKVIRSLNEQLPFPPRDFNDPLYFSRKVVEFDGKIVACALLRLTSEAVLMLDQNCSKKQKSLAVEGLIKTGVFDCQKYRLDEIHAFLAGDYSESFARLLKSKFGFQDATGIPLVLEI